MGVSYRPLWVELAKRDMKEIEFKGMTGISFNLLANMGKNEYILMKNLELICRKMNISPNEVIEFRHEEDINE